MNRFSLLGTWHSLPGMAFGIRQPTLVGSLRVQLDPDFSLPALEAVFERLLGPTPAGCAGGAAPEEALVLSFVSWYQRVHARMRTPVFPQHWLARAGSATEGRGAVFRLALPYLHPQLAADAVQTLASIVGEFLRGEPGEAHVARCAAAVEQLRARLLDAAPSGINAYHLLQAAHRLEVPVTRITGEMFCFGHGANSRLMQSTATDATPTLGAAIAHRKSLTAAMLRRAGLPVPPHRAALTAGDALAAAAEIGYPVVVKPDDQEQGRGVFASLRDAGAVAASFELARAQSERILVEKHVDGHDLRFTVLQGEVIKIMQRRPGGVTGDGRSTIAELVERENASEEARLRAVDKSFVALALDEEARGLLADQGLGAGSVPPPGRFVPMRRRGNVSAGGSLTLLDPSQVHPDNLSLAARAAQCLKLDLAGIDLMLPDPARSWLEAGGVILEVNAMPQVGIQQSPTVYEVILSRLVPHGGRIPVHLLVQAGELPLGAERIHALARRKACHGVSTRDGNWVDGQRATGAFDSGFEAARALLADSRVTSALLVMTPAEIQASGLPCDRVDSADVIAAPPEGTPQDALLRTMLHAVAPHVRGSITATRARPSPVPQA
jgi:cyanophycin synthetase